MNDGLACLAHFFQDRFSIKLGLRQARLPLKPSVSPETLHCCIDYMLCSIPTLAYFALVIVLVLFIGIRDKQLDGFNGFNGFLVWRTDRQTENQGSFSI